MHTRHNDVVFQSDTVTSDTSPLRLAFHDPRNLHLSIRQDIFQECQLHNKELVKSNKIESASSVSSTIAASHPFKSTEIPPSPHTRAMPSLTPLLLLAASLAPLALTHEQTPMEDNDWASLHMASEHHISGFDASSFFGLHDYDSDGAWEPAEILRTYGLAPGSTDGTGGPGARYADGRSVEDYRRDEIVADVLARFDADRNGRIELDEWSGAWARGERLKDWGIGPGHHGDDEYEYEIHHYER